MKKIFNPIFFSSLVVVVAVGILSITIINPFSTKKETNSNEIISSNNNENKENIFVESDYKNEENNEVEDDKKLSNFTNIQSNKDSNANHKSNSLKVKSNKVIKSNIVSNKSNKIKNSNIISNKSNRIKNSNIIINTSNNVKKSNSKSNDSNLNEYTIKIETSTKSEELKYGIKIIHTFKDTYYVYSNGTKILKSSVEEKNKLKYDYSGYNATAKNLLPEAKENMKKNKTLVLEEIKYVNEYRKKAGISNLEYDENLSIRANVKVLDMYYGKYFSHNDKRGNSWLKLSDELGIFTYAENIAYGHSKAKSVTDMWYKSKGHKDNMLNKAYTKIGVAYRSGYWVQNFY